ncbi:amino acid transporter AVT1C-like [Impatiens glandulifera]|uniref:amino acid transporter AVT1C-like n=1 Tax=Impatiens glandulifera TaxID=253017 RepID=UPI001FB1748A|nr:amino acid transporter AVT1C-like [Impatiens glandulifera]
MKNSVSEQSIYAESEDEDDKSIDKNEGDDHDGDSDSSNSSNENRNRSKQNSVSTAWPQSYKQSIDLYGSVPSPSMVFLGNPTLSRFGSSFFSSSLTNRHTPEVLPTYGKPLLETVADEDQQQQRRHSYLYPPLAPRKSSLRKSSKVLDELPDTPNSTYGQAVINGMNVLCGVGILSTPYALKEGGWLGLSLLGLFALLSFYTGLLLRYCLDSRPGLKTYPDIGQAAFGTAGRFAISIVLYLELYASCVEYIILEGDNLSSLFPNAHLNIGGLYLGSRHLFALVATLVILPTVWLRDLRVLSYLSAGGVLASIVVVLCLFWVGVVDHIGIQSHGSILNLNTMPVAIGLYGFCYSGHAVFPNIYSSMEKPSEYPSVLFTSFAICTLLYAGVASMGYMMFGESTLSQFTLNLPQGYVASKIAVWTTVVNPFTKYALTMTPVALSLEELIPSNSVNTYRYSLCIRTALVISTVIVGLCIPFFGLVLALIGSLLTMLVTLILPCACYLRICGGKLRRVEVYFCILIIGVGMIAASIGSFSAISEIVKKLR